MFACNSENGDQRYEKLAQRITALENALAELKDAVEYGFDNIDETNLTAETVEKFAAGGSAKADSVSVGQFAAGLRLTLRGRELSLGSGPIPLNTVRLPEPGIRDYEAADACWPVGSIYATVSDALPEDLIGIGEWENVTPPGAEFLYYERVA